MLKVVTAQEMQQIDRITIDRFGVAGTVLMERAGLAVVSRINELFYQKTEDRRQKTEMQQRKILVLCGGGNNGGDGFVAARILHDQGRDVEVFSFAKPQDLKGDANTNYDAAVKFGVKIYPANKFLARHSSLVTRHCLIVDALLGTGLNKDVLPPFSQIIEKVNRLSSPVVSVDIPSGVSSDTGQIMGCAIKAHYTVTFGLPKRGHLLYPGAEYTGKLFIEDIGFPKQLLVSEKIRVNLPQREDAISLLPERPGYSHKGTYGHVLLLAGSKGKTGAALMAAKACLRTGAGLVTIGIPDTLVNAFQSRVTEEMLLPLADKGNGTLSYKSSDAVLEFLKKRANVLAIGPGLSADDEISRLVAMLIAGSRVPIVIDADGLNALTGRTGVLKKAKSPVILTPHSGEMARLLQKSEVRSQKSEENIRASIEKDRINTALLFSKQTKIYLILKGAPTIIAAPDGNAFINPTGNPGMATAGTGDVLTGMISAFLAQRLTPQSASILGVYIHGLLGDIVAAEKGEHSLIASDIISAVPKVFRSILNR
ncbi:MAG: NAD(P)H-hydrate dehydratase [Nitrospirae bacterium]|nr:NAD(P)H-hydrate dehydratase [Nitrospirota bacterium]